MALPTEEQINRIHEDVKRLNQLTDQQLILYTLSELVMSSDTVPPAIRISLMTVLRERSTYLCSALQRGQYPSS